MPSFTASDGNKGEETKTSPCWQCNTYGKTCLTWGSVSELKLWLPSLALAALMTAGSIGVWTVVYTDGCESLAVLGGTWLT